MARKVKIENHIKKRHDRAESKRLEGTKSKRRFFLIVCEGEKTEPNYFKSLKEALPKGVLDVCEFTIEGEGYNTESLVKKSLELKSNWEREINRKIDKLWVVFDRDSFKPKAFNNAIQTCINKSPKVEAAWTNEAFELWYLLHFHYYNTGINRKEYQDLIEGNFKKKGLKNYEYKKNCTEMFALLETHGSREDAIRNATNLEKHYAGQYNYATQNPCTMVHKLVAELFGLEEIIQEENAKHKFQPKS